VVAEDTLYLTSGEALKRLTAGYNTLAADLYWIRALQYFGDTRLRLTMPAASGATADPVRTEFTLLYPLLDLTTTLDPQFNIAYRFGAVFLAEASPAGAGRPDQAIALLEKGLGIRPHKWEYMQDLGFVYYWWRHDYKTAAEWFAKAADVPGAPWFLKSLAATTLAEGGDRASSRTMWQAIRESAEGDWLRNDADRRLSQLTAMDTIEELQRGVDRFSAARGQPVAAWSEISNRPPPADPAGTPYELDRGRVRLSAASPLFPLPEEPQARIGVVR
jgi:tetratricopeptide (TPR) repeat protein